MATIPTPEQTARALLRILVHGMGLRAGDGALVELLSQRVQAAGLEWHDVPDGLKHAASHGWLLYDERNAWIRLMYSGFVAA